VTARGLLRQLLGNYLGLPPRNVGFAVNPFGKPSLAGEGAASGIRFNVSHSDGLALLGFTRGREIGIDLEKVRSIREQIAERFFAPAETAFLRSLPVGEQTGAFFQCWTRKEAYIKARGDGLSRALDSFEVAFGPGVAPAILRAADEADAASRWTVVDLQPAEGFAGALVVEGRPVTLKRWRWKPATKAQ
jgi:4'-phosphopantetheinyl transferase